MSRVAVTETNSTTGSNYYLQTIYLHKFVDSTIDMTALARFYLIFTSVKCSLLTEVAVHPALLKSAPAKSPKSGNAKPITSHAKIPDMSSIRTGTSLCGRDLSVRMCAHEGILNFDFGAAARARA